MVAEIAMYGFVIVRTPTPEQGTRVPHPAANSRSTNSRRQRRPALLLEPYSRFSSNPSSAAEARAREAI
jgi:hypothetical protein